MVAPAHILHWYGWAFYEQDSKNSAIPEFWVRNNWMQVLSVFVHMLMCVCLVQ